MKQIKFAMLAAIAAAIPLALSSVVHAATPESAPAQVDAKAEQAPAAKPSKPSKAAGSTKKAPNIMGVWEIYPDPFAGVGDENLFFELEAPEGGPKLREPYATEWKRRTSARTAALKAGAPLADRSTLCLPEGMPGIMGAIFPLQILQTPGQVTVLAEFLTQTRRIKFGKKMPPVEEVTPSFYGYSVGRWEGKTLVVETLGVREDTEFFEIPHSSEMKITERIRLTKPGYMENQVTIEDPKVMLEPYKFTWGYKRNDDYEMTEYICEKEDPLFKVNADGTVQMRVDDMQRNKADSAAPKASN